MAILYFLHCFVPSQLDDTLVPTCDFKFVEDACYEQFPWGQVTFTKLKTSLHLEYTIIKQLYRLSGVPYTLNVWMYEYASQVRSDIAIKNKNNIPRILNWIVVAKKPKYDSFLSNIFSEVFFLSFHLLTTCLELFIDCLCIRLLEYISIRLRQYIRFSCISIHDS